MQKQEHNQRMKAEIEACSIINGILGQKSEQLVQFSKEEKMENILPHSYIKSFNIKQGVCYQQHSPNLCGYHAIFNAFCFLKTFNREKTEYSITSCWSFWQFKIQIQKFLFKIKEQKKLGDNWPWTEKHIKQGDLQRVYNKYCMNEFQLFSIFRKHQNFIFITHTWSFQYGNISLEQDEREELQQTFLKFKQYEGDKPLVIHLMMGITTHWLTFLAIKQKKQVEYWFYDSQNEHYLDYNQQQILQLIEKQIKQSMKYGKPEPSKFEKQSYCMCIKDIQSSLKLIINCLQGKQSLYSYQYNKKCSNFANKLHSSIGNLDLSTQIIRQYSVDITQFLLLKIQWDLLSAQSRAKLEELIEYSQKLKDFSQEGCLIHSLFSMQKQF